MSAHLKSALFALAFTGLALPAAARADSFTIVLTPPTQTVAPGSTVTFSGTVSAPLTNTAADFINEGDVTFYGPSDVTSDTSIEFTSFPDAIAAGTSASGSLFTLTIPSTEMLGAYSGTLILLGGPDFNTYNQLGQVNFNLNVASSTTTPSSVTPEPSSYLLLATGLLGTYALVRRQRALSA